MKLGNRGRTMNIAHRGFSGKYPENTMLAFERAITEAGCDAIETDVHLSADGKLVLIHDETLDRTTGTTGTVGKLTLEQIRQADAGRLFGPSFVGERVPLLAELLDLARQTGVLVNLELKNGFVWYQGMEQKAIDLIFEMGVEEQVWFSSFNHPSMALCRSLCPGLEAGLLYGHPLFRAEEYGKTAGAGALHPYQGLLSLEPELIGRCKAQGMGLYVWTVNQEDEMRGLMELEVDGIITNYPDRLQQLLRE